jgi:prepilin-type N-terminal cleavage/methylation domain-containing protein
MNRLLRDRIAMRHDEGGFTLVELLITVVLLAKVNGAIGA